MTSTKRLVVTCLALGITNVALATSSFATTGDASGGTVLVAPERSLRPGLIPPLRLADVVVNTPQPSPPAAVQPEPVVVPVVAPVPPPPRREVVHHHDDSYMSTIAVNALMGALAGALVGGALYYLEDNRTHVQRIAYWAAGGVLVGAGVGVVQIMVESRTETIAESRLPHDPAPTYRLALLTSSF
jgi:hypothetical protein